MKILQEQCNSQKQNDKHNTSHNYDADVLFLRLDRYNRDDTVFLKAA